MNNLVSRTYKQYTHIYKQGTLGIHTYINSIYTMNKIHNTYLRVRCNSGCEHDYFQYNVILRHAWDQQFIQ